MGIGYNGSFLFSPIMRKERDEERKIKKDFGYKKIKEHENKNDFSGYRNKSSNYFNKKEIIITNNNQKKENLTKQKECMKKKYSIKFINILISAKLFFLVIKISKIQGLIENKLWVIKLNIKGTGKKNYLDF